MRRAIIGTFAGWLASAACVLAQSDFAVQRVASDRNVPPERPERMVSDERMPAVADRAPGVSPYAPYGQTSAHFDGQVFQPRKAVSAPTNGTGNAPAAMDGDNGGDGPCGPDGRMWVSFEYLLWWNNGLSLPPLLTSSPQGTPLNTPNPAGGVTSVAGVLGQPTTTIVFGNGQVGTSVRSGYRGRLGLWLDECNMFGIEGSFLFLGVRGQQVFVPVSNANDIIMRQFFNATTNQQDAQIVAFPGVLNGTVSVNTSTELYFADANLRRNLFCGCNMRVDFLAGYRFASLSERLSINETLVSVNPNGAIPVGATLAVSDRFGTDNWFHGGQVGLAGEWRSGHMFIDWRGAVALGAGIKHAIIAGSTTTTVPGGAATALAGGLLAQATNSGVFTSTDFSVIPEVGVNVGIQASDHLRFFVGYTWMFWSNVIRPGGIIDLTVNPTQIPPGQLAGAPRPAFQMNRTDFWMQGVSFGAQLRF